MLLTERYEDQIHGTLSCYDRIVIHGTIPGWCFDKGMTSYLYANNIRIFDYPQFAGLMRDEIRNKADSIAKDSNLQIEFIRKTNTFRKEARIKEIIKERGEAPGLVHIFSAMESCTSYKPWHDKATGKTYLKYDSGKCLHYYFYFIDPDFGLCYMRVPTWAPFRLQFYMNGHNWLASKLTNNNIGYVIQENAFLQIDDFKKAQELSDNIKIEKLHTVLDILAKKYCPVINTHGLIYHWSVMQVEYATDIVFKKQDDLKLIYDHIIRTATHSVKPENIASFLGQKLHMNYQGEMGNNFNTRILGTRIKHQKGAVSIKMYDKFGIVLRIETTSNNIAQFQIYREVQHRDGATTKKMATMKKNIYSLFPLAGILKASNRRYLEYISTFDDPSQGLKKLNKVSEPVKKDRSYKGFNFFSNDDRRLFEIIARGEFNIQGFRNKNMRQYFPDKSASSISRIIKRLRIHGLIKKARGSYKYYLTALGKSVITTGLRIRELFVIPELAGISVSSC